MSERSNTEERIEQLLRAAECPDGDCSCEEYAERLYQLLDAELPESEAERLAAHAATCPRCSEREEAEAHVRELLRRACCGAEAPEAPEQLRARIVEQFSYTSSGTHVSAQYSRTEYRGGQL